MYKKTALLLLLTAKAMAAPTIYPTDITLLSKVKNNTTSNLIADSADSHRIYVMPPSVAQANVQGLHTLSANLGFCREMANDQEYSANLAKKIHDLTLQEADSKKDVDVARQKLLQAKEEAAKFATQARLQDLVDLDSTLTTTENRLSDLYEKVNDCSDCDSINKEIDDLIKEKAELLKNRREITKQHAQDVRTYERYKSKVKALQEDYTDLDVSWGSLRSKVKQVRNDFLSMYEGFGKMEGARAAISFKSDWDDNVSTLRNHNPGFEFTKIQTQKAQILSSITLNNQIPGAQAIIAYEVGGQFVNGVLSLSSYPESLTGNVVLSLVGTCPAIHPDWFNVPADQARGDRMKYGLTVSYEYPSVFRINAKAHYNMYRMYQKTVQSGSSGGFFSSNSWSSVEERNVFNDSFRVTWDETDPDFSLSDVDKAKIEAEMRMQIFNRMATLVLPQAPDHDGIIKAVGAPPHGALVLSDSLMETCPGNGYCVAGIIALNVLDAIFGNSSSTSSYLQTYNTDLVEEFSRTKVMYKPAITSYQ